MLEGVIMTFTPMVCITVIAVTFVIGEYLGRLTKGYVSAMVFACFIALFLFWSNLIPATIAVDSTLLSTLGACGTAFLLVNMGTSLDIEQLLAEWKTVVICCVGLVGLGILSFTLGILIFGREYSLTAAPVVSGGLIAYQIVSETAAAAGRQELAGYAALVLAFQGMVGMPIASACLKKELINQQKSGKLSKDYVEGKKKHTLPDMKLFPDVSPYADTFTMKFAKMGIAAVLAWLLSTYVFKAVNVNIMYLLVGILLRKLNFLPRNPLINAGGYGYIMLCMYSLLFNGFATVSPSMLINMIWPVIGNLILGVIGISIFAVIFGKLLGYNPLISIACGMTALFGYPGTEIISREVCASMTTFTEEERGYALSYVMPKMIVGGFTTVTIASIVFAGIVAPMIFA
jgi:hypothetical protein